MLSNYLQNFIGIRGLANDTIPESGLYINDLQSVSIKMLSNLATEEQKNFLGVYNEITTRALNEFEADVMNKAQKFFRTNVLIENDKSGFYKEPYQPVTASPEFKGVSMQITRNISKYLSLYINTVQLYLEAAGTENLYIYNSLDGTLLDIIQFNGVKGMNRISIDKSFPTYGQDTNIFIGYDGTSTGSISVDNQASSSVAIIQGVSVPTGSSVIDSNFTMTGDSYGIIVDYNVKCDISEFISSNRDSFKFALWYKFGSSIMFDRMDSIRLNKYTLSKTAQEVKELYNFYEAKYDESMEAVLNNMNASEDQICFSCNKKSSYKYLRP